MILKNKIKYIKKKLKLELKPLVGRLKLNNFLLFFIFLTPWVVKAEIVGTWAWKASGCRDKDLSESSHEEKIKTLGAPHVENVELNFINDRKVYLFGKVEGYKISEQGSYVFQNDKVKITSTKGIEDIFPLTMVGKYLIYIDEASTTIENLCKKEKVFVRLFTKISESNTNNR